jgi:hypothetical protein
MAQQILQIERRPTGLQIIRGLIFLAFVVALTGAGLAQEQRLSTLKIESASLERTLPYAVIVPPRY